MSISVKILKTNVLKISKKSFKLNSLGFLFAATLFYNCNTIGIGKQSNMSIDKEEKKSNPGSDSDSSDPVSDMESPYKSISPESIKTILTLISSNSSVYSEYSKHAISFPTNQEERMQLRKSKDLFPHKVSTLGEFAATVESLSNIEPGKLLKTLKGKANCLKYESLSKETIDKNPLSFKIISAIFTLCEKNNDSQMRALTSELKREKEYFFSNLDDLKERLKKAEEKYKALSSANTCYSSEREFELMEVDIEISALEEEIEAAENLYSGESSERRLRQNRENCLNSFEEYIAVPEFSINILAAYLLCIVNKISLCVRTKDYSSVPLYKGDNAKDAAIEILETFDGFFVRPLDDKPTDALKNAKSRGDRTRIKELLEINLKEKNIEEILKIVIDNPIADFNEILAYLAIAVNNKISLDNSIFERLRYLKKESPFYYVQLWPYMPNIGIIDLLYWFEVAPKYIHHSGEDQAFLFYSLLDSYNNLESKFSKDEKENVQKNIDVFYEESLYKYKYKLLKAIVKSYSDKKNTFKKVGLGKAFFRILGDQKSYISIDRRMTFFLRDILTPSCINPEPWLKSIVNRMFKWQEGGLQNKTEILFNYDKIIDFYIQAFELAIATKDVNAMENFLDPTIYSAFNSCKKGNNFLENFWEKNAQNQESRSFFIKSLSDAKIKPPYENWSKVFTISLLNDEEENLELLKFCMLYDDYMGRFMFSTIIYRDYDVFYKLLSWLSREENMSYFLDTLSSIKAITMDYLSPENRVLESFEKEQCNVLLGEITSKFNSFYSKITTQVSQIEEEVVKYLSKEIESTGKEIFFSNNNEVYLNVEKAFKSTTLSKSSMKKKKSYEDKERLAALQIIDRNLVDYVKKCINILSVKFGISSITECISYLDTFISTLVDTPHTGACWLYAILTEKNSEYNEDEIRELALTIILSKQKDEHVKQSIKAGIIQMALSASDATDSYQRREARMSFRLFIESLEKNHILKSLAIAEACRQIHTLLMQEDYNISEYVDAYIKVRYGTKGMWGDEGDIKALGYALQKNIIVMYIKNAFVLDKRFLVDGFKETIGLFFEGDHYQRVPRLFL